MYIRFKMYKVTRNNTYYYVYYRESKRNKATGKVKKTDNYLCKINRQSIENNEYQYLKGNESFNVFQDAWDKLEKKIIELKNKWMEESIITKEQSEYANYITYYKVFGADYRNFLTPHKNDKGE